MATSKADRMKAKAKQQVDAHNADGGLFSGMDPIQPEPKKKRGRPKKTEATNNVRSGYEVAKEAEEKRKQEGSTLEIEVEEYTAEQKNTAIPVTVVKHEPEAKPQKKSERKSAFSVWMDKTTAAEVKLYSAISGVKMTDIIESAIAEYLNNHKLTATQKEEYKKREQERINNI